ncbi:MAG TPA: lipocalin-like domain-containing protein [Gammaproteobacteria bacterium]|nr:lipocalin-like domain-containing protein [Gammaproteobacteria bacterium]
MSTLSFAGTWRLVDAFALTAEGKRLPSPLGEKVLGQIMYDEQGNMSAQLMAEGRPLFSARSMDQVPAEEVKQAFLSYTSYWGTYRIDAAAGTVTHHVIGANAPSWPGGDQVRYFELNGNRLTLKTPPIRGRDGVKLVQQLIWERV